jgi:hypothetical protein
MLLRKVSEEYRYANNVEVGTAQTVFSKRYLYASCKSSSGTKQKAFWVNKSRLVQKIVTLLIHNP